MAAVVIKEKKCANCFGHGICKDGTPCPECKGQGHIPANKQVEERPSRC